MSLREVGSVKDTTTITLYHPATGKDLANADGTPMTITLHGPYSTRYKTIMREQQQRRLTDAPRGARAPTMDADEIETMSRELVVRCVETWSLTLEGDKKLAFSPDAVNEVFTEFPWVRDQVNAAIGNVADFLAPQKPH
jgi:hypothetical protein